MKNSEFIAACRDGGRAIERALRELDRCYFVLLLRECRRVVRDAEAARDVVQETFIKVWRRCATFRGDADLLAWIRVVLRRSILDHFRSHAAREVPSGSAEELIDEAGPALLLEAARPDDESRGLEAAACFERCWERFAAACPAHAAVIGWIAEDGLDHEQIAALLERSPGATREYISQCRKRAREYLAEWYELAFADGSGLPARRSGAGPAR